MSFLLSQKKIKNLLNHTFTNKITVLVKFTTFIQMYFVGKMSHILFKNIMTTLFSAHSSCYVYVLFSNLLRCALAQIDKRSLS